MLLLLVRRIPPGIQTIQYYPLDFDNFYTIKILGAKEFIDTIGLAKFLANCQFKYGGIAKAPGEHPGIFGAKVTW